jgi:hypothetical protein
MEVRKALVIRAIGCVAAPRLLLAPARGVFTAKKNVMKRLLEALHEGCGRRWSRLRGLGCCIRLYFGSGSCTSSHVCLLGLAY